MEVASFARIVVVVWVGSALEVELAVVMVVTRIAVVVASMMDIQGCIVIVVVVVVVVEVSAGAGAKELAELVATSAVAVVGKKGLVVEIVWADVVVGKVATAETAPAAAPPVATIVAIVLVDSASRGSAMVVAAAVIPLDSPAWRC